MELLHELMSDEVGVLSLITICVTLAIVCTVIGIFVRKVKNS